MIQRKNSPLLTVDDIESLFAQYLMICNRVIEKYKADLPYQQVLHLEGNSSDQKPFDVAIYDDQPKAAYSLYLANNKLINDGQPSDVKKAWRIYLTALEDVVNNPDNYIDHPEQLDLGWLKSRAGFF